MKKVVSILSSCLICITFIFAEDLVWSGTTMLGEKYPITIVNQSATCLLDAYYRDGCIRGVTMLMNEEYVDVFIQFCDRAGAPIDEYYEQARWTLVLAPEERDNEGNYSIILYEYAYGDYIGAVSIELTKPIHFSWK